MENNRGVGIEDGLVRIEYSFEKPRIVQKRWNDYDNILRSRGPVQTDLYGGSSTYTVTSSSASFNADAPQATYTADVKAVLQDVGDDVATAYVNQVEQPANETGITVEGSISDQQFHNVSWFPTEETTHVMVLQLFGQTEDNIQVQKAVTVKNKPNFEFVTGTLGNNHTLSAKGRILIFDFLLFSIFTASFIGLKKHPVRAKRRKRKRKKKK